MSSLQTSYRPTLGSAEINSRLAALFVPGPIVNHDLDRRMRRIDDRFRSFSANSPWGIWAPGHPVTGELRQTAEQYLPLAEIGRAVRRLLSLALRFHPLQLPPLFRSSPSWHDAVSGLPPVVTEINPARFLRRLADDETWRHRAIFSLFLPRHYGGEFDRYPGQSRFLRSLLASRPSGSIRCLDAACGSGEGTYGLVGILREAGYCPDQIVVHGTTVEPLELFAAAHGWFPHDPARQSAFRREIAPLFDGGGAERVLFFREDLIRGDKPNGERYDLVVCNGLLGGPIVSDRHTLGIAVERLCAKLLPNGTFLAADRFHGGWKKNVPGEHLKELLARNGLTVREMDQGVAGVRTRT